MQRSTLSLAIAVAAMALAGSVDVSAKNTRSGHKFKGSIEAQYRSNDNISLAPSSGQRFDYATLSEFGIDDDDDDASDTDADDDFDDGFDDFVDVDPSEDDIEVDDAIDEDGDGIDDLIDSNADNVLDKESRFSTKLAFAHRYTFANGTTSWNNGFRFATDTHNQRDDLDKFNWAFTTGLAFAPRGSKHSLRPSLSYVALDRDASKFSSTFVASLGYGYRVSKRLNLSATYNYQDKDISSPRAPDARVNTLEFGAEFEATDKDIFKLGFAPKVEDSTEFTRNTDAWGWEVAYTRRLPWDMAAGLGYRFNAIDYKNLTPAREDDSRVWGMQLARSFGRQLLVELGYESGKRDSNIPSKDASNESLYFGGTWKF